MNITLGRGLALEPPSAIDAPRRRTPSLSSGHETTALAALSPQETPSTPICEWSPPSRPSGRPGHAWL